MPPVFLRSSELKVIAGVCAQEAHEPSTVSVHVRLRTGWPPGATSSAPRASSPGAFSASLPRGALEVQEVYVKSVGRSHLGISISSHVAIREHASSFF